MQTANLSSSMVIQNAYASTRVKNATYNVIIIGAGRIGAQYDTPSSKEILSHAHAFSKHRGFTLLGFIDRDKHKAVKAAKTWGGRAFNDINAVAQQHRIDVVVVAVPDETHYATLKVVVDFPVKIVLLEKPFAKHLSEAREIIRLYKKKRIPILINYNRRFVPEFIKLNVEIKKGSYGRYLTGNGYYGKGILHNGSHMIDLLRYLIGEVDSCDYIDHVFDFYPDDPSVSCVLRFHDGSPFILQHLDSKQYTVFEMDLLFEKKRLRIINSGFDIERYRVEPSKLFKGYRYIVKKDLRATSLHSSLYFVADNVYGHLVSGKKLLCTANDGYRAMEISLLAKDAVGAST
jgi:predicted dehydrogenase